MNVRFLLFCVVVTQVPLSITTLYHERVSCAWACHTEHFPMAESPPKRQCLFRRTIDAITRWRVTPEFTTEQAMVCEFMRTRGGMHLRWAVNPNTPAYNFLGLDICIGEHQTPDTASVQLMIQSGQDRRHVYLIFMHDQDGKSVLWSPKAVYLSVWGKTLQLYSIAMPIQPILDCMKRPEAVWNTWNAVGLGDDVFENVLLPYLDPVEGVHVNYAFV